MEITLNIKAPELVEALNNIAGALGSVTHVFGEGVDRLAAAPQEAPQKVEAPKSDGTNPPVQNQQQAPPQQQQQAPTSVPTQAPQQQQPAQTAQTTQAPPQQQSVPTSAPSYSFDQIAVAAQQLVDAGNREQVVQLLSSFGAQALTQVPQEQYGAFATKLRELGAQI